MTKTEPLKKVFVVLLAAIVVALFIQSCEELVNGKGPLGIGGNESAATPADSAVSLSKTVPADGAEGVKKDGVITLYFNQSLLDTAVTDYKFALYDSIGSKVGISERFVGSSVVLSPNGNLVSNKVCKESNETAVLTLNSENNYHAESNDSLVTFIGSENAMSLFYPLPSTKQLTATAHFHTVFDYNATAIPLEVWLSDALSDGNSTLSLRYRENCYASYIPHIFGPGLLTFTRVHTNRYYLDINITKIVSGTAVDLNRRITFSVED